MNMGGLPAAITAFFFLNRSLVIVWFAAFSLAAGASFAPVLEADRPAVAGETAICEADADVQLVGRIGGWMPKAPVDFWVRVWIEDVKEVIFLDLVSVDWSNAGRRGQILGRAPPITAA